MNLSDLEKNMLLSALARIEGKVDASDEKIDKKLELMNARFEHKLNNVTQQLIHLDGCLDSAKDLQKDTMAKVDAVAKAFPGEDFAKHLKVHLDDEKFKEFVTNTKRNLLVEVLKGLALMVVGAIPATYVLITQIPKG